MAGWLLLRSGCVLSVRTWPCFFPGGGTGVALSAAVSGASGSDAPLRDGGAWALAGAHQGWCQLLVSEAAGRRGDLGAVGGRRAGACMVHPAGCLLAVGL